MRAFSSDANCSACCQSAIELKSNCSSSVAFPLARLFQGVKSATLRDGRVEESRSLLGRELRTTLEVVDHEEPRLFTLRALDSPVPFTVRHELEPADGGTRLTVTAEGDVPGFAAGLLARRAEKQLRNDFERLKQILEG